MHTFNFQVYNRNLFTYPPPLCNVMSSDLRGEVGAIKSKLDHIHDDMKKFIEHANQQHLSSILSACRSDFSNAVVGYATGEIESGLDGKMVKDCHMREACKALFSDLLKNNLDQIRNGEVPGDSIDNTRSKLNQMRERAPYGQCKSCFSEVARILDRQIDLMRSLRIYRDNDAIKETARDLPEESVVREILEPLGNKQRLQMLKALSCETRTFSALSGLTGLRGGNLLFHLQKLMDGGMILQRHERGDYMITEKGYRALMVVSQLYWDLATNKS